MSACKWLILGYIKTLLRLIETLKGLHIITFAIKYLHLKSTFLMIFTAKLFNTF
jgi:hypothetical protein